MTENQTDETRRKEQIAMMREQHPRTVALHSLGCKVNAYETEAMRQQLEAAGYEVVPFAPGADVYVINTCSVTNIADRKSRQMLNRAKKMNPEAVVVAVGCYVQTAKERTGLEIPADICLGNNKKGDLVQVLAAYFAAHGASSVKAGEPADEKQNPVPAKQTKNGTQMRNTQTEGPKKKGSPAVEDLLEIGRTKEYEPLFLTRCEGHTRAYVKVQDGCSQFCSYCIIPYARGRARSRELSDILKELTFLTQNGVQEVVLTGIHLSSYGLDLSPQTGLLELIERVHELPGIRRIRLGSLEPGIITEAFARSLTKLPKLCPHFHLSLQSGCNTVLLRMNRKYTAEEYREKCLLLRGLFSLPALTTDVIVGFPGETDAEFEETYDFLRELALYETHIFKYSRRQGTRADRMPEQITEEVKSRRSDILLDLNEVNKTAYEDAKAGESCEVLFEEKQVVGGQAYYTGHTKEYVKVFLPTGGEAKEGTFGSYENRILAGTFRRDLSGLLLFKPQ